MVGEIRDTETAQIAIQSSLTGHLVLQSTPTTWSCSGSLPEHGVDPYNFVSRSIASWPSGWSEWSARNVNRSVTYPREVLLESGMDPVKFDGFQFKEGTGCLECNGTGYHGRTAIHELLDLSDKIRDLIIDKKPVSEIKRAAYEEGMTSLRESAIAKVMSGETTLKEINKVTFIE
jgi:type IV pilus assembly protein PilB